MFATPALRIASRTPRDGDRVLFDIEARVVESEADVGVGLQVEHPVATFDRVAEPCLVKDVAFDEPEERVGDQRIDELVFSVRKSSSTIRLRHPR